MQDRQPESSTPSPTPSDKTVREIMGSPQMLEKDNVDALLVNERYDAHSQTPDDRASHEQLVSRIRFVDEQISSLKTTISVITNGLQNHLCKTEEERPMWEAMMARQTAELDALKMRRQSLETQMTLVNSSPDVSSAASSTERARKLPSKFEDLATPDRKQIAAILEPAAAAIAKARADKPSTAHLPAAKEKPRRKKSRK